MRHPSILDVVRAVTTIAPAHPEVRTWWYSPASQFRLHGELDRDSGERVPLEVAVEFETSTPPDFDEISAELANRLWMNPITVRPHRGAEERQRLVRILSGRHDRSATGSREPSTGSGG